MKLIFVHGRAQGEKDPDDLLTEWIDTFLEGLKKANLELPINYDQIHLPFYGKRLDELVREIDTPIESIISKGSSSDLNDIRFIHDFLSEIADNSNISAHDIDIETSGLIRDKGPLNWEWVQSILRAIDRKDKWSEATLKKFTLDAFHYLTNSTIKEEIETIVKAAIDDEPTVLVGHSLGSVVSYNILRENPQYRIVKFITLGSPLGVNAVRSKLKVPLQHPKCILNGWINAYDERDVVSLHPLDGTRFEVTPPILNKNNINNHTENRHGIKGYLNDGEIASVIHKNLLSDIS